MSLSTMNNVFVHTFEGPEFVGKRLEITRLKRNKCKLLANFYTLSSGQLVDRFTDLVPNITLYSICACRKYGIIQKTIMAHGNTCIQNWALRYYMTIKRNKIKHQSVLFCSVLLFSIYTLQKSLLIKLERIYLWLFNLKVIMSKHSKADR